MAKSKISKRKVKKAVKQIKKLPVPVIIILVLLIVIALGVLIYLNKDEIFKKDTTITTHTLVQGEGDLIVHYMNIGQGDSILIDLPDGKSEMLIDCGCKGITKDYQTEIKPYLNEYVEDNTIEYLVLTHTDEDHVSYLDDVINDFQVSNIYMPYILAAPGTSSTQKTNLQNKINELDSTKLSMFKDPDTIDTVVYANFFIAALSEENCTIHINADLNEDTTSNVIVAEDNSYVLTFICPTYEFYANTPLDDAHSKNAVSPVIILEYNSRRLVFTGDSNAYWTSSGTLKTTEGNEWYMVSRIKKLYGDNGIDCDILKVAHHGAEEASSNEFLDVIHCEYGVISCGKDNTYKHPRQEALDRMASHNMTIYRTDLNGTITCTINKDSEITFNMEISNVSQDAELIGADK